MDGKADQSQGEVWLARDWTRARVLECLEKEQRFELVDFLRARYAERFFRPIRCLREAPENEEGYGFSIMALCCLLIETFQCYEVGVPASHKSYLGEGAFLKLNPDAGPYKLCGPWPLGGSAEAFKNFFDCCEHARWFPDVDGESFYKNVRCGLLHQSQTEDGWRITKRGKFMDRFAKTLNRDEFADRLEGCFSDYLGRLSTTQDWGAELWVNARRKMWWLAKLS